MRSRRLFTFVLGLVIAVTTFMPAAPAQAVPRFEGWEGLGGGVKGAPSVSSWSTGRLDVFVRGGDDQLYHKWFDGSWSWWEPLYGTLTSAPAAVSWGSERIDIVVLGPDNGVWHKWWNGAWSHWESLGGYGTSTPGITSLRANHLDVFVRGGDNTIYHKRWTGEAWNDWYQIDPRPVGGAPAAASSTGQIVLAVRASNDSVLVKSSTPDGNSWNGYSDIGGTTYDDVGIAWRSSSRNVFARAGDNHLWMWHYNGADAPRWRMVGGYLTSGPAAIWQSAIGLDVFVRGSYDNGIWRTTATEGPDQQ